MQHKNEPNALLNLICFLLPFPTTIIVPALITLAIALVSPVFVNDTFGYTFNLYTLPFTYSLFVIFEIAASYRYKMITTSARRKEAAECFLYSASFIGLITIPIALFIIWNFFRP